jgi:hypothetical protein
MSRFVLRAAFACAAALLLSANAHAQLFRSYLSVGGNDANPCTLPAPCRLLPAALAAVADGGEVWILDSANYNTGTVAIAKNVAILAIPGRVGSLIATGGADALTISTPVKVSLRNLTVAGNPLNPGGAGIRVGAGATLVVDGCVFANLTGGAALDASGGAMLHVRDSVIRDSQTWGFFIETGASLNLERSTVLNNGAHGIVVNASAGTTTTAAITDTHFSGNGLAVLQGGAITATASGSQAVARAYVSRSTLSRNNFGLFSSASAPGTSQVTVTNSIVAGNAHGLVEVGTGAILSPGNNHFADNGSDVGALGPATLK